MKVLSIVIALIIMACGLFLLFNEVRFDAAGCDVYVCSRRNEDRGYGINYRNGMRLVGAIDKTGAQMSEEVATIEKEIEEKVLHEEQALPFQAGERLTYDVYYKKVRLGTSILTFHGEKELDGSDFYYITFSTDAPAFDDLEEIYAYKGSFLPYRIFRHIKRMGHFPLTIREEYDQEAFTIDIYKKSQFMSNHVTMRKAGKIHNALLLTYYYRMKKIITNPERYSVLLPMSEFDVVLRREETIRTELGEYPVYVFRGEPSKFTFWLSADEKRIPLKIEGHNVLGHSFAIRAIDNADTSALPKVGER